MASYRIDPRQPTGAEIRRLLAEQLEPAASALRVEGGPDAAAVHDGRKRIKKARSLLRLARGDFGAAVVRQANAELRAVAAALAGQRDADAMVEAVDRLATATPSEVDGTDPAPAIAAARDRFAAGAAELRSGAGPDRSTLAGAARSMERTGAWLATVPPRAEGWVAIAPGFGRQYARGRRLLHDLPVEPTDDELHDWRKRAKDLWYHQRLLRDLWPEVQEPVLDAAERLADLLGEDHDLAVLAERMDGVSDAGPVLAVATGERRRLQAAARHVGALLYADEPGGWVARHGAWWCEAGGVLDDGPDDEDHRDREHDGGSADRDAAGVGGAPDGEASTGAAGQAIGAGATA